MAPLRKLMHAYCRRLGLQASQVRFMVGGERARLYWERFIAVGAIFEICAHAGGLQYLAVKW